MKKYVFILCYLNLFLSCKGQINENKKMFGTWEESHRDYLNVENDDYYEFSKKESLIYSGQKLVFTNDSLIAYVTYLTENIITPIVYRWKPIKTDTLEIDGNLKPLLEDKGAYCSQLRLESPKNNGYKDYFDEYEFYLFNDNTIALISDYSIHFFRKISDDVIFGWKKNEFNQVIVKGKQLGNLELPLIKNKKYFMLTYLPEKSGESYINVEGINFNSERIRILKLKETNSHTNFNKYIKIDENWKKINITISDPKNSIHDNWELRYKYVDKVAKVLKPKTFIYSDLKKISKNYLVLNDEIEVVEEKNSWLKIRYYGKKTIEGWIKKSDVE